ncbi:hypothetical protein [Citrobacter sp. Res13-Lact-LER2-35-b]|uniref:putative T6SS immunity periplasmic lipoprotein n=1 Tax=Citrobacter sp. Res13-Lact-LER2-35-b TaxID=2777957 RepID=UPI001E5A487C|nr:hypothetical protein [Citrobacter sp. Res13-Lact-LER2-35-b]
MSGSAFAVTHHAFSSGAGRTSDGNGSHASTLKSPSYTKSVSWQHYPLPILNNETVVSAITYNVEKPLEQIIFPSDKQPKSGLFCILPTEFKFKTGQEYLTQIEVNIRTNGEDKKSKRKAYVSTFQVVQKGDSFNIIQTAHK